MNSLNKGCILLINISGSYETIIYKIDRDINKEIKEATRLEQQNKPTKLKPFDNTLMDDLCMYDKMPYSSNYDLCNSNTVGLESGNLLKSYRVKEKEPYIIEQDEKRFHIKTAPVKHQPELEEYDSSLVDSESLTPDQLESLLEDSSDM